MKNNFIALFIFHWINILKIYTKDLTMTVKDLNTSVNFNYENGLIVYLDKVNKTFRFISDDNITKPVWKQQDYRISAECQGDR
jgi:hypothetical protein